MMPSYHIPLFLLTFALVAKNFCWGSIERIDSSLVQDPLIGGHAYMEGVIKMTMLFDILILACCPKLGQPLFDRRLKKYARPSK